MTFSLVNAAVAALSLFSVAEAGRCKPRPPHLSTWTSDAPHHQTSSGVVPSGLPGGPPIWTTTSKPADVITSSTTTYTPPACSGCHDTSTTVSTTSTYTPPACSGCHDTSTTVSTTSTTSADSTTSTTSATSTTDTTSTTASTTSTTSTTDSTTSTTSTTDSTTSTTASTTSTTSDTSTTASTTSTTSDTSTTASTTSTTSDTSTTASTTSTTSTTDSTTSATSTTDSTTSTTSDTSTTASTTSTTSTTDSTTSATSTTDSTTSTTSATTTSTTSATSTTSSTTSTKTCTVPAAAPTGKKNVVYYTNWSIYERKFNPKDLPADKITHILHSFANIKADGTVFLSDDWADTDKTFPTDTAESGTNVYGIMKQYYLLKKANRKLKVQLSIGGATFSATFPSAASTAENRERFAKSAVKLVADLGLDGLDLDWEFPKTATEGANYVLLLKAVRAELDAYSKKSANCYRFLLTIAASAGPATYTTQPLAALAKTVDWFNLMAYDYTGSWSTITAHQANLHKNASGPATTPFNTKSAVEAYIAADVKAEQIVLGMPIYGRGFSNTDGLGKSFSGVPAGTWEAGIFDYKLLPLTGAVETTDTTTGTAYSYDKAKKEFISYDTPASVQTKVNWAKSKGLGGSMFWEASADGIGARSLVGKSASTWGTMGANRLDVSENLLEFPESEYDNVKAGMV